MEADNKDRRRSKRSSKRSSILKLRDPLTELTTHDQDETSIQAKKTKRSSKRVSFSETKRVKLFLVSKDEDAEKTGAMKEMGTSGRLNQTVYDGIDMNLTNVDERFENQFNDSPQIDTNTEEMKIDVNPQSVCQYHASPAHKLLQNKTLRFQNESVNMDLSFDTFDKTDMSLELPKEAGVHTTVTDDSNENTSDDRTEVTKESAKSFLNMLSVKQTEGSIKSSKLLLKSLKLESTPSAKVTLQDCIDKPEFNKEDSPPTSLADDDTPSFISRLRSLKTNEPDEEGTPKGKVAPFPTLPGAVLPQPALFSGLGTADGETRNTLKMTSLHEYIEKYGDKNESSDELVTVKNENSLLLNPTNLSHIEVPSTEATAGILSSTTAKECDKQSPVVTHDRACKELADLIVNCVVKEVSEGEDSSPADHHNAEMSPKQQSIEVQLNKTYMVSTSDQETKDARKKKDRRGTYTISKSGLENVEETIVVGSNWKNQNDDFLENTISLKLPIANSSILIKDFNPDEITDLNLKPVNEVSIPTKTSANINPAISTGCDNVSESVVLDEKNVLSGDAIPNNRCSLRYERNEDLTETSKHFAASCTKLDMSTSWLTKDVSLAGLNESPLTQKVKARVAKELRLVEPEVLAKSLQEIEKSLSICVSPVPEPSPVITKTIEELKKQKLAASRSGKKVDVTSQSKSPSTEYKVLPAQNTPVRRRSSTRLAQSRTFASGSNLETPDRKVLVRNTPVRGDSRRRTPVRKAATPVTNSAKNTTVKSSFQDFQNTSEIQLGSNEISSVEAINPEVDVLEVQGIEKSVEKSKKKSPSSAKKNRFYTGKRRKRSSPVAKNTSSKNSSKIECSDDEFSTAVSQVSISESLSVEKTDPDMLEVHETKEVITKKSPSSAKKNRFYTGKRRKRSSPAAKKNLSTSGAELDYVNNESLNKSLSVEKTDMLKVQGGIEVTTKKSPSSARKMRFYTGKRRKRSSPAAKNNSSMNNIEINYSDDGLDAFVSKPKIPREVTSPSKLSADDGINVQVLKSEPLCQTYPEEEERSVLTATFTPGSKSRCSSRKKTMSTEADISSTILTNASPHVTSDKAASRNLEGPEREKTLNDSAGQNEIGSPRRQSKRLSIKNHSVANNKDKEKLHGSCRTFDNKTQLSGGENDSEDEDVEDDNLLTDEDVDQRNIEEKEDDIEASSSFIRRSPKKGSAVGKAKDVKEPCNHGIKKKDDSMCHMEDVISKILMAEKCENWFTENLMMNSCSIVFYKCNLVRLHISFNALDILDIKIERREEKSLIPAKNYCVTFMLQVINPSKLKELFKKVTEIPQLLQHVTRVINVWRPFLMDIMKTYYHFLGKVYLHDKRIDIKFMVPKNVRSMFYLKLMFDYEDEKPVTTAYLEHGGLLVILDDVCDILHKINIDQESPLLSCCKVISNFCENLSENRIQLKTNPFYRKQNESITREVTIY